MSEETKLQKPYIHLLEDRDPVEVLRTTPHRLAAILDPLSPEAIQRKPAPHKWSLREILCHLADCELVWAWRLRMIYGQGNPALPSFDQDPWARAYDGIGYTIEAAHATFTALRQWNLALIEGLSEADKQRTGTHPELGIITLWHIVEIAAGHDLHHLRSLEQKTPVP